jgi:ABC-type sugar transport system ATPase subunit
MIRTGSVASSYSAGIVLVPGDRKGAGIIPGAPIRSNVVLTTRVRKSVRRSGWRRIGRETRVAKEYIRLFGIRAPNAEALVGTLSGGNQQKVVLARAIEASPRVLLVEEPTQGIDINAKVEIRRKLRALADDSDCAVVIATSEFEELLGLADVIHVMQLGQLVATLQGDKATYREILAHALP